MIFDIKFHFIARTFLTCFVQTTVKAKRKHSSTTLQNSLITRRGKRCALGIDRAASKKSIPPIACLKK